MRSALQASLARHPDSPPGPVVSLTASLERAAGEDLRVRFVLEGDMRRIRVPPPAHGRGRELWKRTCFEAFIAVLPRYREFNLSPSGQWDALCFSGYRIPEACPGALFDTQIRTGTSSQQLELEAILRLGALDLPPEGRILGLSAVVEHDDGGTSYWALRHPSGKPDFHHPDAFAVDLHALRN